MRRLDQVKMDPQFIYDWFDIEVKVGWFLLYKSHFRGVVIFEWPCSYVAYTLAHDPHCWAAK